MISLLFPPFGCLVEYWSVPVDILVDLHMGLTLQLSTKSILAGFKHLTSTYFHSCASVLVPSPGIQNCYSQTKVIFPFFMRLGTCNMQTKLVCVCVCVCMCAHMRVCEGEWDAGTLREVELETEQVFTVPHPFWALFCPRVSQFTLATFESHPSGLSTQHVILLATKMILANTVCLSAMRPINKEVQLYFSFILSTYLQVHMSLSFITTSTILTSFCLKHLTLSADISGLKRSQLGCISQEGYESQCSLIERVHPEPMRGQSQWMNAPVPHISKDFSETLQGIEPQWWPQSLTYLCIFHYSLSCLIISTDLGFAG